MRLCWIIWILVLRALSVAGQVPPGAVARFTFNGQNFSDEVSGESARFSEAYWTSDRFGNRNHAVNLAGKPSSFINLGTNPRLRQRTGSVSMWVNLDDVVHTGNGYKVNPLLLTKNSRNDDFYEAYALYYNLSNSCFDGSSSRDSVAQVGITMLEPVIPGQWYHLVLSYDDDALALYVNGNLINRSPKGFPTVFELTDSVLIGHSNNKKNNRFTKGSFDDVIFYDRVLTHDEVVALYQAPNPNKTSVAIRNGLKASGILATIGILVLGIRWRLNVAHRREKQKMELQNLLLETELRVNRALMNPHFVFNSLSTLQDMILREKTESANSYLVKFSRLIRRLIETNLTNSITIEAEVELLKRYAEIEMMRFGGDIEHNISVLPGIDVKDTRIPVMMIQPFVENAIWHGLHRKKGKKRLDVTFAPAGDRTIRVTVDDNGIGRKSEDPSYSTDHFLAVTFIEQRLKLLNSIHKHQCRLSIYDKPEGGTRVEMDVLVVASR